MGGRLVTRKRLAPSCRHAMVERVMSSFTAQLGEEDGGVRDSIDEESMSLRDRVRRHPDAELVKADEMASFLDGRPRTEPVWQTPRWLQRRR